MWSSKLFILLIECTMLSIKVESSTHWMVTESGLIQPRLHSPFDMARPYDLLAFLNQEKHWNDIFDIYNSLMKQQIIIDNLWLEIDQYNNIDTGIDVDCLKTGYIDTVDWHRGIHENSLQKIPREMHLYPKDVQSNSRGSMTDKPDCKRLSLLTFSMFAFEHLESMMQRDNLEINPADIVSAFFFPLTPLLYGHWVTGVLRENSSSWLHYHMASLFWTAEGVAPKALDCGRAAVLYAPREYKGIALGNLGRLLHCAGKTKDAIIVLNAAIDHDPTNVLAHFDIANAYTLISEYDAALRHYDETLKLKPGLDLVVKHKFYSLCHQTLALRIKTIQEKLNKYRHALQEYSQIEEPWPKIEAEFLKTIDYGEDFDHKNIEKNYKRMTEITGLNIKQFKDQNNKNSLIKFLIEGPQYSDENLEKQGSSVIDAMQSLDKLINIIKDKAIAETILEIEKLVEMLADAKESSAKAIEQKAAKTARLDKTESQHKNEKKPTSDKAAEDISDLETGIHMYPNNMKINRNAQDFDREPNWPTNQFCKEISQDFPHRIDAVFPVFLPFENKGMSLKSLLTEKIGVPLSEEYELPWHPPTCSDDGSTDTHHKKNSKRQQELYYDVVKTGYLRQKLLKYVSNDNIEQAVHKQDAEIGQRIYVAMQMKLAPKWVLYTLASLYWRVRGNNVNALHCLIWADRLVSPAYTDLVLVSLASVYLEMGHFEQAFSAAEDAFQISSYEPATNFILAQLNMVKKHRNTFVFHLKQVVRVEPDFMNGLARNVLNRVACASKQTISQRDEVSEADEICTHAKPSVNVGCENDGEKYHMTNIQCFSSLERVTVTKTFAHLTTLKEKKKYYRDKPLHPPHFYLDDIYLEHFTAHHPDKTDHIESFDLIINSVDNVLERCENMGCECVTASTKPEDFNMQAEECQYSHFQLSYWMYVVGFKDLLKESKIQLPSRIKAMSSSDDLFPDCRGTEYDEDDFYSNRLIEINTEGWVPVIYLIHQFCKMFDYFDFNNLGAKVSKYLHTRPRSWMAALTAGWWCGAGGNGVCASLCLTTALHYAPTKYKHLPIRLFAALLQSQTNYMEAKRVAYLALHMDQKSKIDSFLVGVMHSNLAEHQKAVWMYRYSLTLDENYLPAKACLHSTLCRMFFGKGKIALPEGILKNILGQGK